MSLDDARLIGPTTELETEFMEMALEYRATGDERYDDAIKDFQAFVRRCIDFSLGIDLAPGRVPCTFYWLFDQDKIIGRSGLRHRLTPDLENEGGHIGYDIRPSERRKGYGTLILKLTLEKAAEFGLQRVLLTCDADNLGSAKIIEKSGGHLTGQEISRGSGKLISQYWIEL
ncbi:MAG: GNAT family N-acetyltransferase [Pyrinomonadaceae bacterium]